MQVNIVTRITLTKGFVRICYDIELHEDTVLGFKQASRLMQVHVPTQKQTQNREANNDYEP